MNLNKIIGIKIKALRIERKLSQENLAGLSEIDRTYLQSIERGERNISLNVLVKISNADIDYFIKNYNTTANIKKCQ